MSVSDQACSFLENWIIDFNMTEAKTGDFAQNTLHKQLSGPIQHPPIHILANALAQITPQISEPQVRKVDLFFFGAENVSAPSHCPLITKTQKLQTESGQAKPPLQSLFNQGAFKHFQDSTHNFHTALIN